MGLIEHSGFGLPGAWCFVIVVLRGGDHRSASEARKRDGYTQAKVDVKTGIGDNARHIMQTDYLIVGSGIAALSLGALLAKSGRSVRGLEAHYAPGGYGHTFEAAGYRFNAQLHYVWNCGPGRSVNRVLGKLGLAEEVTFEALDPGGFDRMRMPGYTVAIPSDMEALKERLSALFPGHGRAIAGFCDEVRLTAQELDHLPSPMSVLAMLPRLHRLRRVLRSCGTSDRCR